MQITQPKDIGYHDVVFFLILIFLKNNVTFVGQ